MPCELTLTCRARNRHPDSDYGYAAMRAYAAYKDPTYLNWAAEVWSFAQNYTISSGEASSNSSAVKSFPIQSQCQGSACSLRRYVLRHSLL